MSIQENEAAFRAIMNGVDSGDLTVFDQYVSADYHWHGPGGQELAGVDALKEMVSGYLTAFPDMTMTVNEVMAAGDRVIGRWTAAGTHGGPLGDIPATGKPVSITGINILRFEDGKCVEEWENFDELAMLQQIGVVPSEEEASASA